MASEKIGFKKLKLSRIEILMQPANKASEKVAIKNGYIKEGKMRKAFRSKEGKMKDCYLYAKVL
jgi:[ribosomal protein S5]-alanine N-acetyltransferase